MLGHAGTLVYIGLPKPDAVARFELSPFFNKRTRILVSLNSDFKLRDAQRRIRELERLIRQYEKERTARGLSARSA